MDLTRGDTVREKNIQGLSQNVLKFLICIMQHKHTWTEG